MFAVGVNVQIRIAKCPKFYTTVISGKKILRQKERKFGPNFKRNKLP